MHASHGPHSTGYGAWSVVRRTTATLALLYCGAYYAAWEVSHKAQDHNVAAHFATPTLRALHWFAVKAYQLGDGMFYAILLLALIAAVRIARRIWPGIPNAN